MIPAAQITHWRQHAPWVSDDDVEQDLVISRAIVELFERPFIRERVAFRGGTALHKLVLTPATRYSEDIDLVFLKAEGVGAVFDAAREALAWIDPAPNTNISRFATMYFRFTTTAGSARRLKVEVATREVFSEPRVVETPFAVDSPFFKGATRVGTYTVEELLATKLRALFQRKKGRDLYDLWWAAQQKNVNVDRVYGLFLEYWKNDGNAPLTRALLRTNMQDKHARGTFAEVAPLLTAATSYDPEAAYTWFTETVLPLFPA